MSLALGYLSRHRYIMNDIPVLISGNVSVREDKPPTIIVETIEPLESSKTMKKLFLRIKTGQEHKYNQILQCIKQSKGFVPVMLEVKKANCELWVNPETWLISELESLLGQENVKLVDEFAERTRNS